MSVGPVGRGAPSIAPPRFDAPKGGANAPAQTGESFAAKYARDSFEPAAAAKLAGPRINMDGFAMQAAEALEEMVGLKQVIWNQVRVAKGEGPLGPTNALKGDGLS